MDIIHKPKSREKKFGQRPTTDHNPAKKREKKKIKSHFGEKYEIGQTERGFSKS